ncbi:RHS repeat protein [Streptomyces sp. HB132]|uniref:RHS repeat protein n=1 Tax=Streptomyces sp. HB132 TaxID=767388 RepID=UPI00196206C9
MNTDQFRHTTGYTYDANNNVTKVTDAAGKTTLRLRNTLRSYMSLSRPCLCCIHQGRQTTWNTRPLPPNCSPRTNCRTSARPSDATTASSFATAPAGW